MADDLDLSGLFQYQRDQQNGPITDTGQYDGLLAQLRKLDPNAHFEYRDNSGSSNEGGNATPNSYELVFDQGKLPNAGGTRTNDKMPAFNSAGQAQGIQQLDAGEGFSDPELFKPNVAWDSPYGHITDSRNVNTMSGSDSLWKYAPALIMAIATMGAGAPLAAGVSGAASMSGGTALESMLAQFMPGLLQSGASGSFNYGSLANMLSQLAGAPGWAGSLASQGTNYLTRGGKGP